MVLANNPNEICITFMRHGRSRADDENVHEGRYDSPLTETGRAQARSRARVWQAENVKFDLIVASILQRTYETAQIVSAILNAPIEGDPDWMELDNGPLAGMPRDVALKRYPPVDFRNPFEPFCGSGESDWELYCRAARAVEKVIRRGAGNYLVVAHGEILNAALRSVVGAPPSAHRQGIRFALGDAGYVRAVYYPKQHQWMLEEFKAS